MWTESKMPSSPTPTVPQSKEQSSYYTQESQESDVTMEEVAEVSQVPVFATKEAMPLARSTESSKLKHRQLL